MSVDAEEFLVEWNTIVESRDAERMRTTLAEDISMGAPPYWTRIEGKAVVAHLLGIIIETIEDFTYHRQWTAGVDLALEFRGHVGECELQGIDLITLDDDGRIKSLDVMIRPENALVTLRDRVGPKMAEFFSAGAG